MGKCGKILYSQTGHRWQHNMARALCMLDNYSKNTDTHTICNMYCLSTATSYMNGPQYYGLSLITGQQQIIQKSNCKQLHHVLWGPLLCCGQERVKAVFNIRLKGEQWIFVHAWCSVGILQACFPYAQYIVNFTVFDTLTCSIPFCIINTRLYLIQGFHPCPFKVKQGPPPHNPLK
jgi:hypothetical protein